MGESGASRTHQADYRRRQRPQGAVAQKEHYSGKKKAHTDKNILLVNGHTRKVAYLGPTVPAIYLTVPPCSLPFIPLVSILVKSYLMM